MSTTQTNRQTIINPNASSFRPSGAHGEPARAIVPLPDPAPGANRAEAQLSASGHSCSPHPTANPSLDVQCGAHAIPPLQVSPFFRFLHHTISLSVFLSFGLSLDLSINLIPMPVISICYRFCAIPTSSQYLSSVICQMSVCQCHQSICRSSFVNIFTL